VIKRSKGGEKGLREQQKEGFIWVVYGGDERERVGKVSVGAASVKE